MIGTAGEEQEEEGDHFQSTFPVTSSGRLSTVTGGKDCFRLRPSTLRTFTSMEFCPSRRGTIALNWPWAETTVLTPLTETSAPGVDSPRTTSSFSRCRVRGGAP